MNKNQAKERIEKLRGQVEYHAKKYYDDDKPEISDFEYDMLMVELRNLEKDFPEFKSSGINKAVLGINKTYKGYIWKRE